MQRTIVATEHVFLVVVGVGAARAGSGKNRLRALELKGE